MDDRAGFGKDSQKIKFIKSYHEQEIVECHDCQHPKKGHGI